MEQRRKRIQEMTPEELQAEGESLREEQEEADRFDRPALWRLLASLPGGDHGASPPGEGNEHDDGAGGRGNA